ncbi:AMP-binding protein [Actinomadura opuntiae]|uniref:AMP-binding protein n=1 Tax=Actinomadura sp. OS1-43 TaxID=604315 RepID=UPI00255ADA0C|nr:AMP-binding protein [Actinomadura sp. OS1-43]MDL4820271.1 AMP-binding protein [Actinomadura sp. OS1-43]
MPTLLDRHIDRDGSAIAISGAGGAALTWSRLGERVDRWSDLLAGAGLGEGDRVAAVLGNRPETFELLLACLHSGLVLVPVNWHLTAPEIRHILADSGSRALVAEPAYAATAAEARTEGCALALVLGDRDRDGFAAAEPLLAAADPAGPARRTCGSTMLYTSGTTGAPKGVVNNLFTVGAPFERVDRLTRYARTVLGVPAGERVMLDGPWYHSAQLFFSLLSLLQGSRLVLRPRFDPAATLRTIDREQITAVHLVPTQFVRLLRLDEETRRSFSGASLRRVWHGAGPCPAEVKRAMIDWWGPVLVEYYGATEGGAVTLIDSHEWLRRPGSVGRAVPAYELLVVGPDGTPLPPGREGRVFVRRKGGQGFRYHNDPGKTRKAHLAPDTFTFGELGRLDEDGYLYLAGREQDMIVSGGVNVYPAEVEAALLAHPDVRDAAVTGVPDPEFGERVVAVVEPAAGAGSDLAVRLDRHCRGRLAGFKTPRAYHFVDALPREPTGKLRKDALRLTGLPGTPR